MWDIKKLIKQYDNYTGAPCAGDNNRPLYCAVLLQNTMPYMSQVLRERAIGMLTAGMSTRAVYRELRGHVSTISHFQRHFREFSSPSNRPHYNRPCVWRCVGKRFADVNLVNIVPYGGVMV